MNPFSETYKSLSTLDLLEIIKSKENYQQQALEAAEMEINNRKLSPEEYELARAEQEIKEELRRRKNERKQAIENRLKSYGDKVLSDISLVETKTTDQRIRLICYGIALI